MSEAWAGHPQEATFTQIQGNVQLFSKPSKTLQPTPGAPRALFEGEYFLVKDAGDGDLIENGNIVRTSPGARARVVYPNGDQVNVGSGTAYRVTWDSGKTTITQKPQISLMYGKLRGVIEKGGPRTGLRIKTKTATMGVRGTDFFIAERGSDGSTEVSIIRGSVEVTPKGADAKPIQVKSGFSAEVASLERNPAAAKTQKPASSTEPPAHQPVEAPVSVEIRKTTQEDYAGIEKSTVVHDVTPPPPQLQKAIQDLEVKATATTLKDIKVSDPKLFMALEKQKEQHRTLSSAEMNKAALENLLQEAPKAPPKSMRKPYKSEIENIEDGAYERYFKKVTD